MTEADTWRERQTNKRDAEKWRERMQEEKEEGGESVANVSITVSSFTVDNLSLCSNQCHCFGLDHPDAMNAHQRGQGSPRGEASDVQLPKISHLRW